MAAIEMNPKLEQDICDRIVNRRSFVRGFGVAGLGLAAAGLTACSSSSMMATAQTPAATADTAQQIFTAALIAEGLATTMYFNALTGKVIQDVNLAGPGGTATALSANGNLANVGYVQGALSEEIQHATLLRSLLNISGPSGDPVQTFYFPTGTFDTLANFIPVLLALETAFIGAYMTAVQEFSLMLGGVAPYSSTQATATAGTNYTQAQLASFAKISAAILGVEAEHRTLARAIPPPKMFAATGGAINIFPSDNLCYESNAGLTSVYNGSGSAVTALQPFVTASSGYTAYPYAAAINGSASVLVACTGSTPS